MGGIGRRQPGIYAAPGAFGKGRRLSHKMRRRPEGEPEEQLPDHERPDPMELKKHTERWKDHRVIAHLDMDAFFAAIEQQHCPDLRGRPVIVGGLPGQRGVVSTCSYEARVFGVRSAMPAAEAARRCPDGVFLETDGAKYAHVSVQVLDIMRRHSPIIEVFSIDEAFIDITGIWERYGSPGALVRAMQEAIRSETGLTGSAGIGPNKIIAKMASGMDKPCGLTEVCPCMVAAFLENLPVDEIFGVGPATTKNLARLGIHTVGELARYRKDILVKIFGVNGASLHEIANGGGAIEVTPFYSRPVEKSIGHETTLPWDTDSIDIINANLRVLSERVGRRMRKSGLETRRVTLKFRFDDFTTFTRARTLSHHVRSDGAIFHHARSLFEENTRYRFKPVRLLGISVSKLRDKTVYQQNEIFDISGEGKEVVVCEVMDKIKDLYGDMAITYSSAATRYRIKR